MSKLFTNTWSDIRRYRRMINYGYENCSMHHSFKKKQSIKACKRLNLIIEDIQSEANLTLALESELDKIIKLRDLHQLFHKGEIHDVNIFLNKLQIRQLSPSFTLKVYFNSLF